MQGRQRQTAIYIGGISGLRPKVPVAWEKLQRKAQEVMPQEAFAYVAAGAGHESTVHANRAAFERWRIVPRMLRDVSELDMSVELFGQRLPAPLLLSPVGVLEIAHSEADRGAARAAADAGIPMIFSNQASTPMEDIAAVMGDSPRWFQLYWGTSNDLTESLVQRAERCGCSAIALTLDTTQAGWRSRDLDVAYLPFLRGKGIAQYTSDPVFQRLLDEDGGDERRPPTPTPKPTPAALRTLVQLTSAYPGGVRDVARARKAVERFTQIYSRLSLSWEDLPFLRERTKLPILLKGILHADDATRAVDAGVDGIIVSNHGGRQVDGSISTLEALPGVVKAVDGRVPVLLDSGVRGGADMFKAISLGATAVCIGRPYVYGLAIAGADGVREVIANMLADFELTMALSGCRTLDEVREATLVST